MTTTAENTEKLVRMANQIGAYFSSYPEATAVEGVREHIAKFWSAKMRAGIIDISTRDEGATLSPIVIKAIHSFSRS